MKRIPRLSALLLLCLLTGAAFAQSLLGVTVYKSPYCGCCQLWIEYLLKEKPKAVGLAVPGMPLGSPGMESARPQPYETLLVMTDGSTKVWAKH